MNCETVAERLYEFLPCHTKQISVMYLRTCNVYLFTDEPCNVRELCDGKVCCEGSLLAFFAFDANANVCSKDHAHVVATVADGCCCVACVLLHEADDGSLLCGRAAAADDRGRHLSGHEEVLAEVVEAHLE